MEKLDYWKKFPSFLIGEPLGVSLFSNDSIYCADLEQTNNHSIEVQKNSYFFLNLTPEKIPVTVAKLVKKGIPNAQIFALLNHSNYGTKKVDYACTAISFSADESPEEFRTRIFSFLEIQHQLAFHREISSLPAEMEPSLRQRAMDRARLVHGLASTLKLGPKDHSFCIQTALQYESEKNLLRWSGPQLIQAWQPDTALLQILLDISEMALRNPQSAQFRQNYKLASSQLSFKFRSDLKGAVDLSFQHIWEETSHAA